MKNTKYILSFFVLLAATLIPSMTQAADANIQLDKIDFGVEANLIPANQDLIISVSVEETEAENITGDLVFFVNDEEAARESFEVDSESEQVIVFPWTSPDAGELVDFRFIFEDLEPADSNEENNVVNILQAPVYGPEELEAKLAELGASEEAVGAEVVDLESLPSILIHAEKLSWNSFRFRPSQVVPVAEQEYLWSFGDGTSSNNRVNEHEYEKPGTFQVQLEVITGDGQRQVTTMQAHVGFFNLANWRLWALILLLGLIIVVGSVIASFPEKKSKKAQTPRMPAVAPESDGMPSVSELVQEEPSVPVVQEEKTEKPKKKGFFSRKHHGQEQEDESHNVSSESESELIAATGYSADQLAEELSFLEDFGSDESKEEMKESTDGDVKEPEEAFQEEEPVKKTAAVKKKKSPAKKKSSAKKKTTTKKKKAAPKKKAAAKKKTAKKKTTKKK